MKMAFSMELAMGVVEFQLILTWAFLTAGAVFFKMHGAWQHHQMSSMSLQAR